jgi:hypothetical protein
MCYENKTQTSSRDEKDTDGMEFEPRARLIASDGVYPAQCVGMEKAWKTDDGQPGNDPKLCYVKWRFSVDLPNYAEPQELIGTSSLAVGEKSKARKWATAIMQRTFPLWEGFSDVDVLFKDCQVFLKKHAETGYLRIEDVIGPVTPQAKRGKKALTPQEPSASLAEKDDIPF